MYLVSLYFDDRTSKRIKNYINKVAKRSGNSFMIEGNVPPHITVAAFNGKGEDKIIEELNKEIVMIKKGTITWASIGSFKSSVIFLAPVLNGYLHNISENISKAVSSIEGVEASKYYLPFQWIPHTTIGKKLNRQELFLAFQELEKNFSIFSGEVVKIGLSRTNPYRDIFIWEI